MLSVYVPNHEARRMIKASRTRAQLRHQRAFENHVLGHLTEQLASEIHQHLEDPNGA